MSEYIANVIDRLPISISHPSNRFWAATSISAFGWVMTFRLRRKGERQQYRRWFKVDVFNYNYSEKARKEAHEKNNILNRRAFPKAGREECCSCGQTIPHGEEKLIPKNSFGDCHSQEPDTSQPENDDG